MLSFFASSRISSLLFEPIFPETIIPSFFLSIPSSAEISKTNIGFSPLTKPFVSLSDW